MYRRTPEGRTRTVDFRILGPLEVWAGERNIALGGAKQRTVLAYLLINRGKLVSSDRLIDELWGEHPPPTAAKTVQVFVSRLRKALGDGILLTRGRGYVLETPRGSVDLDRFEALVESARRERHAGRARDAARTLAHALALWRGEPLADLEYEPAVRQEVGRLEELRLSALEDRIDADLAAGGGPELVAELEALVRDHGLRERLRAQLALALYRGGRQADALAALRDFRTQLRDELGLEPRPDLQELERSILRQDETLGGRGRRWAVHAGGRLPALLGGGAVLLAVAVGLATYAASRGGSSAHLSGVAPNSVGLIDARSGRITAEIPVGARPGPIAATNGIVWVGNLDDRTVSRIDVRGRRVVRTVSVGETPAGLAADGGRVWLTTTNAHLLRIDPAYDDVAGSTNVGRGEIFQRLEERALAYAFGALWLVSPDGTVSRLDGEGRRLAQVDVGNAASGIAAGAGSLWVANAWDGTVSRVDPSAVVTATIPVGHVPVGVAFGGGAAWVANSGDGTLVRIDPGTNAVTATVVVGADPEGVAFAGGSVWVAVAGRGAVVRVDPRSGKVVQAIETGNRPVELSAVGDSLWVSVQAAPRALAGAGGTLRVELQDPFLTPLDPALVVDLVGWQVVYATCAKLMNYPDVAGPAGAIPTPEVAESAPAVSADGRTYTFTIRRGFRFSPPSNESVTAASFVRAFVRVLSPRMRSSNAGFLMNVVGARAYHAGRANRIAGVVARGDTLTIRLVQPDGGFLAKLAEPWAAAVPSNAPIDSQGVSTLPSAGPYYVASYAPGVQLVLRRNPHYRGPRPHRLDRIVFAIGAAQEQSVRDVEAGRADYAAGGFPPGVARRLDRNWGAKSSAADAGRQRYFEIPIGVVRFLVLNTSRGVFADPTMRRAAAAAIDRAALAAQFRAHWNAGPQGGGPATALFAGPGVPGAAPAAPLPEPDLALARRLVRGRHATALMTTCNNPPCPEVANLVKRDLARIGIDVTVEQLPTAVMFARALRPDAAFDIMTLGWAPDYPDPASALDWIFAPGGNFPHLRAPGVLRELAAASRLRGPARLRAFRRLTAELENEAVPGIAYEVDVDRSFFSTRVGCQLRQPVFGIDLGALCLRR